jgi:quercetin dioxygenase-like cupin family protein
MAEVGKHAYLRTHQISGELLSVDLDQEARAILEEAKQAGQGHAGKTLVKEGPLRLTILGFVAGSSLHEHKAGGPVILEARSGTVEMSSGGTSTLLNAGDILVLAKDIGHSLVASSDAVILLSVAMPEN